MSVSGRVMFRKCSKCGSRLLDDPFSRYKRFDPTRYFARTQFRNGSCGASVCMPSRTAVYGIPADCAQSWTPPDASSLRRLPAQAVWTSVLLRYGSSYDLPATIVLECKKCGQATYEDDQPRWTIEKPPRYLFRMPRCNLCNRGSVSWVPVDESVDCIHAAAMTKLWKSLQRSSWNLDDLHNNPQNYFPSRRDRIKRGPKDQHGPKFL